MSEKGIWRIPIIILFFIFIAYIIFSSLLIESGTIKPHIKHKFKKIKKANMSERFKEIYKYIEKEYGSELERNRRKLIKSIIFCIVLVILTFIMFIVLVDRLNISTKFGLELLGAVCISIIMYGVYKYSKSNKLYKDNYKEYVIKNLFKYINHNFYYDASGGKNLLNAYIEADYGEKFNNFLADDYLKLDAEGEPNIKMANIALEDINNKDKFLYEGIFAVTQLKNNVNGEVRIKKNNHFSNNINKVEMDSEEFEKYFDVYSNLNILAMEILTHDIMEELVQFYNTYKIKFEIVIKNYNIYIRFDTGAVFEHNILRKSNEINTLWIYYNIFNFITSFTIKINKLIRNIEV